MEFPQTNHIKRCTNQLRITQAQCRDVVLQSAVAIPGLQHLLTSQESSWEVSSYWYSNELNQLL